jgi:hypothetical protein
MANPKTPFAVARGYAFRVASLELISEANARVEEPLTCALLLEERLLGQSPAFSHRLLHFLADALEVPFCGLAQNGSFLDEGEHLAVGATRHFVLMTS